jgi:hypothetical protein
MANDTPKIRSEEVRRLLRQRPFQPFRFHLNDGRVYEVRDPEMALLFDNCIQIGFPEPKEPDPSYVGFVFVFFSMVDRLEIEQSAAPAAG